MRPFPLSWTTLITAPIVLSLLPIGLLGHWTRNLHVILLCIPQLTPCLTCAVFKCAINVYWTREYKIKISYPFKMGAKIILSKKRYSTIYLKGLKLCIQEENITMEYLEICGTQCPKKTLQSYLSNGEPRVWVAPGTPFQDGVHVSPTSMKVSLT